MHATPVAKCTLHNAYIVQFSPLDRMRSDIHIFKSYYCHTIQHIFVPACSVENKVWFSYHSNPKFAIFPQIFPRSSQRAIEYSPVAITEFWRFMPRSKSAYKGIQLFPCINHRAIRYYPVIATGHFLLQGNTTEWTMYSLCTGTTVQVHANIVRFLVPQGPFWTLLSTLAGTLYVMKIYILCIYILLSGQNALFNRLLC